jgi:peptidylprolyl isomerase
LSKRTILLAVTAMALAGSLTACGGSSSDTNSVGSPSSPTAEPTAEAPTADPTPTYADPATCTKASSPTKDLKTKPVYVPSNCAPPTETTNTDVVVGTSGEPAKDGTKVTVQYVGVNFSTGEQFDASWDRGDTFPFTIGSGVIPGFSKGVTGMKVGGRRVVVIPPADGYGNSGPVPGGTLAFVIDLVAVG